MSIWGDLLNAAPIVGPLVSAGANIVGSLIAGNAAGHASDTQANAAQQGLDFQKDVYGQRRRDLQPAIGGGGAAANRLSYLLGLDPLPAPTSMPGERPPAAAPAPAHTPPQGLAVSMQTAGGYNTQAPVSVQHPNGQSQQMSYGDAQAYLQHYPNEGLTIHPAGAH